MKKIKKQIKKKTSKVTARPKSKRKKKELEVRVTSSVAASSIFPRPGQPSSRVVEAIMSSAPFSWGDNALSLVSAKRLLEYFNTWVHPTSASFKNVILSLESLSEAGVFVDLES